MDTPLVNLSASSRELLRVLRVHPRSERAVLPESVAWQAYVELRRRGDPDAQGLFIDAIKNLHSRRCISGMDLPIEDGVPDEHRMTDDPFLADLWKAYKRCIRANRTGPASQLLRDIETYLCRN